jgi:O-antigen/teichoic acid export membrane protein
MVIDRSLTHRTATGLVWSWGAIAVTAGMQLVYTAVTARLLEPADFGLVAAALLGLRFVTYFSRFGLASAVVQRPSLDDSDISTAMRLSVLLGTGAALLSIAVSPLLAAVIREPGAAAVMRWMSLGVMIGTIAGVPEALVRRAMRFRQLAAAQVLSYAVGYLGVGVVAAVRGWGVWSLVAATISQAAVMLSLTVALSRPTVRAGFSRASAGQMLSFGGTVAVTGFLEFLASSIDTIAIGRYLGSAGLGQYSRATYLVSLPVELASTATTRVLMPSLSRVQTEAERFARAVLVMIGMLALVVAIPVAMVSAAAPSLVPILLGGGWEAAAAVLPFVGAAYGLALLTHSPGIAAEARGVVRLKLAIQAGSLATTSFLVLAVVITGPTLTRLAIAWLLGEIARHAYYWIWMLPPLGLDRARVADRYVRAAVVAVLGAAPIMLAVRVLDMTSFVTLAISAALGLALCVGALWSPIGRTARADLRTIRQNMAG